MIMSSFGLTVPSARVRLGLEPKEIERLTRAVQDLQSGPGAFLVLCGSTDFNTDIRRKTRNKRNKNLFVSMAKQLSRIEPDIVRENTRNGIYSR